MGNSALIIRVHKTGGNTRTSVTKHVYNTRAGRSRNRCALGALRRTTPLHYEKRYSLTHSATKKKHYMTGSTPNIEHVFSEPYS